MSGAVSRQDKPAGGARERRTASRSRPATRRASESSADLARAFELAAFVESASDAVVGVCAAGEITGWGKGAKRLFGYTPAEALGQPITMLAPADRDEEPGALIARALAGEHIERIETERVAKGGTLLSVQLSVAPISDEDGEFVGAVGIFRDLSAQRGAEEARRAIERRHHSVIAELNETLDELQQARFEDLRRLALMAEYRDDDTNKHTERVARTAALLAKELGLDGETVATIERAAPLHDVGKVGIPDAILLKPGKLTREEFEVIKTHTVIGGRILCKSRFPVVKMAMEIAFTHHERWDGNGYPSGLRGEGIPIAGRIIAVADAFDAMTHARPYKPALSVEHAVDEIERCRGTQFDPRAVDAFMRLDHNSLVDATCR
jgi:putative two-component system response regulator